MSMVMECDLCQSHYDRRTGPGDMRSGVLVVMSPLDADAVRDDEACRIDLCPDCVMTIKDRGSVTEEQSQWTGLKRALLKVLSVHG